MDKLHEIVYTNKLFQGFAHEAKSPQAINISQLILQNSLSGLCTGSYNPSISQYQSIYIIELTFRALYKKLKALNQSISVNSYYRVFNNKGVTTVICFTT